MDDCTINEVLQTVIKDINALKCTNMSLIDIGDTYGSGRLLPVLCENGFTTSELNSDIETLRKVLTVNDSECEDINIIRTCPYIMSKKALSSFQECMADPPSEESLYVSEDDILAALVPYQTGLRERISSLCLKYNFKGMKIDSLGDSCEALFCAANYFIRYDGEMPPFPIARSPVIYRFSEEIYDSEIRALKYLTRVQNSIDFEKTSQCILCDMMTFFMHSESKEKQNKYFNLVGLPHINDTFYKANATHVFTNSKSHCFSNIKLNKMANGSYTISYGNKVFN